MSNSVSPRLAMQLEAGYVLSIPKLRDLRQEKGFIVGRYASPFEREGWWNPMKAYYAGQNPYL